ncbi:MAG: YIP1 family protein [Verrucomicrobiota bacterium]|nr:YIP1 family protein [Limisphaera sp.]MDW8381384.1 YIP1 family protein [Verrucomicrobiota bacterium]
MQSPPLQDPTFSRPDTWTTPVWSVAGRMVNVFGVPGQVFEDVLRTRPNTGHWFWPALLGFLIGFLGGWLLWGNPVVRHALVVRQRTVWEQRIEAGRLTREEADRRLKELEQVWASPLVRALAAGASGLGSGLRFLFWGGLIWAVSRWAFAARAPLGRCCELAGLASLIGVVGMALELLLMPTPDGSPPPLEEPAQVTQPTSRAMAWALGLVQGIFGFWQVGVMGMALAKLTGAPWVRALWVLLAIWLGWMLLWITVGALR